MSTKSDDRRMSTTSNDTALMIKQIQSIRMLGASDDSAMTKQILSTHSPDGRLVDVKSFLKMIDNVLRDIIPPNIDHALNGGLGHIDAPFNGWISSSADDGVLDALAYTVHKISCEISCKCSSGGGGDAHATTMAILNMLSIYSWDAKVVLTLTAFAVNFGELWLIVQLCSTNSLAKFVALLKQLPDILEHSHALKPHFDTLNKLISAMIDVTKCIVEFKELPTEYISRNVPPPMSISTTHIATAAYWIIWSVVACSTQITHLVGLRREFTTPTSQACELSSLADKLSSIHEHLQNQLHLCYQHIEEEKKKLTEASEDLKHTIETPQIDNLKILIKIFRKEDPQALLSPEKTKVHVEVLKGKHILLLISDLDISDEEIRVLQCFYQKRVTSEVKYEILWLPLVDRSAWNKTNKHKFLRLQQIMPWYTANDPSAIEPAFVEYAREIRHFVKMPIGVTLDPQGKVLCRNALNMMWIWGNQAFPFNNEEEECLWKGESWKIELLIANLEPNLPTWLSEQQKVVCFYGGEKRPWIESFIKSTKGVENSLEIGLEMVYVGKNNFRERVKKISSSIKEQQLSHAWQDDTVWFFWNWLERMLYSKTLQGKINGETSVIKKEVMVAMLGYDGSEDGGWAVFFSVSTEMVRGKGREVLNSQQKFGDWEKLARQMGFLLIPLLLLLAAIFRFCGSDFSWFS